jgi:hypothetical protein
LKEIFKIFYNSISPLSFGKTAEDVVAPKKAAAKKEVKKVDAAKKVAVKKVAKTKTE